ncbi:hypothetical protein ACH46_19705 [Gordonia phthalatica]|uniref:Type II toxin-antitoxin system HicA family toxin n=1 Tax=Gordonia phthalatica TaxID=1136941 RepID=A0A0N7FV66_9ACTN|nr:hypothetical protein ACH46_19705 [Gordonia phthalatica]
MKALRQAAKEAGVDCRITEGGRHTIVSLDGLRVPVGRHTEIPNRHAEDIYKEAEPKLGKDWWKK